ncbi:unnamed protein product [Angiostrongylus costaricensis]|uniref:acid phosphatase n=1 Tax=Angiostrongylus costaricensis TaxID=334426 RepID=A0A158PMF2_ANGCS|nr:unnamed protein product [Angiostrongylus costaricensis]
MINNLDIGLEIRKIRGGSLFNDINARMNMKLDCMNRASPICKWIKPLKYFVYSAHDTTVNAFLSVLDITKKVVQPGGYPPYTSAVFIELWINHTNNQPYFKVKSWTSTDTLYPITPFIDACGKATYCKLEIFRHFAASTKPDEPIETVSRHTSKLTAVITV